MNLTKKTGSFRDRRIESMASDFPALFDCSILDQVDAYLDDGDHGDGSDLDEDDPENPRPVPALDWYLAVIGRIPRTSVAEEIDLARRIRAGDEARSRLDDQAGHRDRFLRSVALDGDLALQRLIESHLFMVVPLARSHEGRGVDVMDLIQEGNVGLVRAAETFDALRGVRFRAFASFLVRQAIERAVADDAAMIRLPGHQVARLKAFERARLGLWNDLPRSPTLAEVAEIAAIDGPASEVGALVALTLLPDSLDVPCDDDGIEVTVGQLVGDVDIPSPPDVVSAIILTEELDDALGKLPPREASVLKYRHGWVDQREWSLEEVGSLLGVGRERVRQIHNKALRTMRYHESRTRTLRDFHE